MQIYYKKRRALNDIKNIVQLSQLCQRLEAYILTSTSNNRNLCSLYSDLNYCSDNSTLPNVNNKINFFSKNNSDKTNSKFLKSSFKIYTLNNKSKINSTQAKVKKKLVHYWSCSKSNHIFRNYLVSIKNKFCFKCDTPNVIVKHYPKCSGHVLLAPNF